MQSDDSQPTGAAVVVARSSLRVGRQNGIEHECVVSLGNVPTVSTQLLGRTIGHLTAAQEIRLARAVVLAYDLDLPLLD